MEKSKQLWKKAGAALLLVLMLCVLGLPMTVRADDDFGGESYIGDRYVIGYQGETLNECIHNPLYDADGTLLEGMTLESYGFAEWATDGNTVLREAGEQVFLCRLEHETIEDVKVHVLPVAAIKVTTPPAKTNYLLGEAFDKGGMEVTAFYDPSGEPVSQSAENEENVSYGHSKVISDYTITDGENLALAQTEVTLAYYGAITTQPISVTSTHTVKINGYRGGNYSTDPGYDKVNHVLVLKESEGNRIIIDVNPSSEDTVVYQSVTIIKGLTKDQLQVNAPEAFAHGQGGFGFTMPANDVELTINWTENDEKEPEKQDPEKENTGGGTTESGSNGGGTTENDGSSGSTGSSSSGNAEEVSAPQSISGNPKTADSQETLLLLYALLLLAAAGGIGVSVKVLGRK